MKTWVFIVLSIPQLVIAHPVSYENGYSLMADMSRPLQSYSLIYSPKWWIGGGAVVETVDQKRVYSSGQLGFLIKRWNREESQANIYAFAGAGHFSERVDGNTIDDGGFSRAGLQIDYETRQIHTNFRYVERRSFDGFDELDNLIDAAVGFAPYTGSYEDIHTWLLIRYMDGRKMEESMISPTLRFFYRNFLWEIAMSTRGESQVNFMVRL